MNFKEGDLVRVRGWNEMCMDRNSYIDGDGKFATIHWDNPCVHHSMGFPRIFECYCNQVFIIEEIDPWGFYDEPSIILSLRDKAINSIDDKFFEFSANMLERVWEEKEQGDIEETKELWDFIQGIRISEGGV